MKRNLILIATCSVALAGCNNSAKSAASVTADDNYQDIKDTAADASAAVQAEAAEAGDHANNLGGAMKDGFYDQTDHVANWFRPTKPKPPQSISASYCYHVYQDILCYRQPMPGWEGRLAGYQPLTADPPVAAVMQPLPKHVLDASQLPANRVASSKPVFTQLPSQPAEPEKAPEDGSTPAAAAASDATHEQLPDPALAPQL